MARLSNIHAAITRCNRCNRLRSYCKNIALEKKREFQNWDYWGKPVPGFGDPDARIWIVGLAPAAHGANRTGRMFTGDSSGNWLYRGLHRAGFANQPTSNDRNDGLLLTDVYISAAARCAPPQNKPTTQEIANCSRFIDEEWECLRNKQIFLALGSVAFRSILDLLARQNVGIPKPRPKFGHGVLLKLDGFLVLASYHPSRQNTNTGVLTEPMFDAIFAQARKLLK